MRRRTNNGLFPDGAATNIAQVVEFIKNDEAYVGQRGGNWVLFTREALSAFFQKHIAIDLGCHDDDGGTAVLDDITRHKANGIIAVDFAQVAVFLIGESFKGGGIDDTLIALLREPDSKFRDERFTCAGWCGHHNRLPLREFSNSL